MLGPLRTRRARLAERLSLALLLSSAIALFSVPATLPDGYSWVEHTASEAAAQGLEGAWLARLAFLLFGFAAILVGGSARDRWQPGAVLLLAGFGVLMIGAAAFSSRSWEEGAPYDDVEDLLHSIAATLMGFAFALGVFLVLLSRGPDQPLRRGFDRVAILCSVVLPAGMTIWPDVDGLLQRLMFVVAYLWFALEAWDAR
jgi:hypothetical protein